MDGRALQKLGAGTNCTGDNALDMWGFDIVTPHPNSEKKTK